jgi:hypothetical protein
MRLITFLFVFVSAIACGQTEKFTMTVSGSLGYNRTGIDMNPPSGSGGLVSRYQIETLNTTPALSFLFARRWAAGVYFPYQWRRISNDYGIVGHDSSKDIIYSVGPIVEYFQPIYKGFYASAKAGYCWGNLSVKRENVSNRQVIELATQGITLTGALMYFINRNLAIEGLAILTSDTSSEYDAANGPNFYTDHFSVQIGLKTFFGHSWKN